jgi:hypothetical protein
VAAGWPMCACSTAGMLWLQAAPHDNWHTDAARHQQHWAVVAAASEGAPCTQAPLRNGASSYSRVEAWEPAPLARTLSDLAGWLAAAGSPVREPASHSHRQRDSRPGVITVQKSRPACRPAAEAQSANNAHQCATSSHTMGVREMPPVPPTLVMHCRTSAIAVPSAVDRVPDFP